MNPVITTLAERPELQGPMWQMIDTWDEFVTHDPVGWANIGRIVAELPDYVLVATDPEGRVVARAFSVPLALDTDGRRELPERGWDQVMLWAFSDLRHGRKPDVVSAIEITVATDRQGQGISGQMLAALRDHVRRLGFAELIAPVRPSAKSAEPAASIDEYAFRTRPSDGLPHDPWLRVHVRAGGVVEKVAHASMTVSGSTAEWRKWTGLPFDTTGEVEVPGALVPVHVQAERGYAVYVEPNVWVRHGL
ncbi:GNAT superfamily N-acetyltransferase [Streptomyces sp. V4I23]|uniref:N-acetyltransferase n=1 Tax=Streptomyces sp. V4I23 TaxID=3042282 RepID=UPI002785F5C9|nr:N-acetyltransferase [Streptomyces sp. V4I23]MDQ1010314.1 GNAT superfamily N-acetyltransferase [Streptomyces sp. V4I23]